jgi:hypothetical protein
MAFINVSDYGALGDGSTDDSGSIGDAIAAAAAGDTLVFEAKVYRISAGLSINKSINIEGNTATLKLDTGSVLNTQVYFKSIWGSAVGSWTQTISADTNSFSVPIPTLAVGDTILLELGQDPHDPASRHFVTICKVLGNDGTTVTVDVSIPYAINQPNPPGDFEHKISKVTSLVENISIRNLGFDWFQNVVPDAQIWIDTCRNVIIENITGRFTIAVVPTNSANVTVRNVNGTVVVIPTDPPGLESSGRWFSSWQTENILVENVYIKTQYPKAGFLAENWCRGITVRGVVLDMTAPTSDGVAFVAQGGSYNIFIDDVVIRNISPVQLFSVGGSDAQVRFGNVEVLGELASAPLSLIQRLRWKGALYQDRTLITKTIEVHSGGVQILNFAVGLIRRMWLTITDKTGLTGLIIANSNGVGPGDVSPNMTSGQWIAVSGITTGVNTFNDALYPTKQLGIYTGTVVPGTRLTVVAEVFHSLDTFNLDGDTASLISYPPISHHTSHEPGGSDAMAVNATATIGSLRTLGNTSTSACAGNDPRLSDARTPTAHATTHKSAGSDPIKLDELAAPTDGITLNASTTAHGLLRKLSGNSTEFLNGSGAWAAVPVAATANARVTSDVSTPSTTPQNVTGLSFAIGANETWSFEVHMKISCTSNGGVKFAVDVPSGTLLAEVIGVQTNSATSIQSAILTTTGLTTAAFAISNTLGNWAKISCLVANGGTAGTVQIKFACGATSQSSTVYANSYLTGRKIS